MSLPTTLKTVVSNLLANPSIGAPVTFRQESETAFDADTGKTLTKPSGFTVNGTVDTYSKDEINGTTIHKSDIKLIIEAGKGIPESGDVATMEGKDYRVMKSPPVSLAGVAIIYEVQLRV